MNQRAGGFTLTETLVVVMVSALVMGSIYQMVIMQNRSTREQYAIVDNAQNGRMALALLANDLKEISAVDGDVIAADSTSIQFRALRKAAVSCNKPSNSALDLWVLGAPIRVGDSVMVFIEGNPMSVNDDSWLALRVNTVNQSNCPGGADPYSVGLANMLQIGFTGTPLVNAGTSGALVRSFVATRYRLVDSGEWGQLTRTDTLPEAPLIDRLSMLSEEGLRLRYFNAAGTQMPYNTLSANLNNIMRVQVKVRGKAARAVSRDGTSRLQDSLVATVYLRGNFRTQ